MGVAIICVDAILYAITTRVRVPSLCVTFGGAALTGLHLVLSLEAFSDCRVGRWKGDTVLRRWYFS